MEQQAQKSVRYVVRKILPDESQVTVRQFVTNDADFADRVIARDSASHFGEVCVYGHQTVSPWGPAR